MNLLETKSYVKFFCMIIVNESNEEKRDSEVLPRFELGSQDSKS